MHSQDESWLASSWTHDIRTHLTIVQGALRLMGSGQLTLDQSQEYIVVAQNNVFAVLRMLNNLLDMDHWSEVGRAKLADEQIDNLLTSLIENVKPFAHERRVNLEYCVPKSLRAYCDPVMLERILYNLLSNAIKFTPPFGAVFLSAFYKDRSVQITVSDTGPGLTEKQKEQFQRDTTTSVGGGLGLRIVKMLTAAMKSTVEYMGKKGERNTFLLKIPVRPD